MENKSMVRFYQTLKNNPHLRGAIIELQKTLIANPVKGTRKKSIVRNSKILSYFLNGFQPYEISCFLGISIQKVAKITSRYRN